MSSEGQITKLERIDNKINDGISAEVNSGNPGSGDSPLDLHIAYRIIYDPT